MSKKIFIDASSKDKTRIALTRDGRLDDFEIELFEKGAVKGDIFLAKITRVEPSLPAAFVEYGANRQGFLPLTAIHPDYFKIPVSDQEQLKKLSSEIKKDDIENDNDNNESLLQKENDLEKDHPYAPEMVGLHMYYCGEHYFTSIDQFRENFLPFFVLCRRTILVPGEDNRSLSYTSGVFHDHSDKIKEVPSCLTKNKYPRIGINVLYDINNYDREIKIEDAIPVPEIFTTWQKNQHKLWEDEINPLVKFYN